MDQSTATEPSGALSGPTVASILGIKGSLRVRAHGLSQKPHVILRRVELQDDSSEDGGASGVIYFSLFAQKRIEVKPGKEILVSIAGADGKLRDQPVLFEGDLLPAELVEEKSDGTEGTKIDISSMAADVVPPKLRRRSLFPPGAARDFSIPRVSEPTPSRRDVGIQVQPTCTSVSSQTASSTASVSIQAQPTTSAVDIQVDTESLTPHVSSAVQVSDPRTFNCSESQTQPMTPKPEVVDIGNSPILISQRASSKPEGKERSLSPMELDSPSNSRPPSPLWSPSQADLSLAKSPSLSLASRASSIASSSGVPDTQPAPPAKLSSAKQHLASRVLSGNSSTENEHIASPVVDAINSKSARSVAADNDVVNNGNATSNGGRQKPVLSAAAPSHASPPLPFKTNHSQDTSGVQPLASLGPERSDTEGPQKAASSRSDSNNESEQIVTPAVAVRVKCESPPPSLPPAGKTVTRATNHAPSTAVTPTTRVLRSQATAAMSFGKLPSTPSRQQPSSAKGSKAADMSLPRTNATPTTLAWPYTNPPPASLLSPPQSFYASPIFSAPRGPKALSTKSRSESSPSLGQPNTQPPPDAKALAHIPSGPMSNPLGIRPSTRSQRAPPTAPKSIMQTSAAAPTMPGSLKPLSKRSSAPNPSVSPAPPTAPTAPKKKVVVKPGWQPVKQAWTGAATNNGPGAQSGTSSKGAEQIDEQATYLQSFNDPEQAQNTLSPSSIETVEGSIPQHPLSSGTELTSSTNQPDAADAPTSLPSASLPTTAKVAARATESNPRTLPLRPADFWGPWNDIEIRVSPQEVSWIERQVLRTADQSSSLDAVLRRTLTQLPLVPSLPMDDSAKQVTFSVRDLKLFLEAKMKIAAAAVPGGAASPVKPLQPYAVDFSSSHTPSLGPLREQWKPFMVNPTAAQDSAEQLRVNGVREKLVVPENSTSDLPSLLQVQTDFATALQRISSAFQGDGSTKPAIQNTGKNPVASGTTPGPSPTSPTSPAKTVRQPGTSQSSTPHKSHSSRPGNTLSSPTTPQTSEPHISCSLPAVKAAPQANTPHNSTPQNVATAKKESASSTPSTPDLNGAKSQPPVVAHPLPPKPPPVTANAKKNPRGVKRGLDDSEPPSTGRARKRKRTFKWPTVQNQYTAVLKGDGAVDIRMISFSSDGTQFAVCCSDKTIRIWRSQTRTEIARLSHNSDILSIVWMKGDKGIVSFTDDGIVSKWIKTGVNHWQWVKMLDVSMDRRQEDGSICMAYRDDRIAVSFQKTGVKVWLFAKGAWHAQRSILRQNVTAITFVDDGEALLGGTKDGVLWYCEIPNGTLRALSFLKNQIRHIKVSGSGTGALVAHPTGAAELISLRSENKGKILQPFACKEDNLRSESGFGAIFAAMDQAVIFGDVEGCVLVWDKNRASIVYGLDHGEDEIIQAVSSFDLPPGKEAFRCIVTGTKKGRLSWWSQPASGPKQSQSSETSSRQKS